MPNKKTDYADDEIPIFDEAVVHLRGEYWQMRMWLAKEGKYARFSLKTRNRDTAIDKAKKYYHELKAGELAGKTYFSLTTKQGVNLYLEQRQKDIKAELITEGRYRTLVTHLNHWLDFINKDAKLKELHRTDCENYFVERRQTRKRNDIKISQSTIVNEQATINAMMTWLFRRNETYIDRFDFKKLKPIDAGDLALKRPIFSKEELSRIKSVLHVYPREPAQDKNDKNNSTKAVCGYFHGIAMQTGMRRGEMLQLQWRHISFGDDQHEITVGRKRVDSLFQITVPGAFSKVRRTRQFMVGDDEYVYGLLFLAAKRIDLEGLPKTYTPSVEGYLRKNFEAIRKLVADQLIFGIDGETAVSPRALYIHFERVIELAKIDDPINRGIVPYSFRHSFITHKVNSGIDLTSVAEMCGTSVSQIERVYYRTTKEKMKTNALSDYDVFEGQIVRGNDVGKAVEVAKPDKQAEKATPKPATKKAATKKATAKAKPAAKKVVAKKLVAKAKLKR